MKKDSSLQLIRKYYELNAQNLTNYMKWKKNPLKIQLIQIDMT